MGVTQRFVNEYMAEVDVTIEAGESLSAVFQTDGRALVGVRMPAAWPAGTTHLKLLASFETDGANAVAVRSSGVNVQVNASTDGYETNVGNDAAWAPYLQFQAVDVNGDPVVMASDTTVTVVLKPYL